MPNRDGTGPSGMGPGTGRGWGRCFGKAGGRGIFYGVLIPAVAGIVRDLMNPNGLLRTFSRKLLSNRSSVQKRGAIKADYSVIDEKKPKEST